MKRLLSGFLLAAMVHSSIAWAQVPASHAITGLWAGTTNFQGQEVHLLLRVKANGASVAASIEGPSQGWPLLELDNVQFDGSQLRGVKAEQDMTITATLGEPERLTTHFAQKTLSLDFPMFRVPEPDSLASEISHVDEIKGDWEGAARVQGRNVLLVFHVKADGNRFSATLDSPSITALAMTDARYDGGRFMLTTSEGVVGYDGIMVEPGHMMGVLKRGSQLLGLTLRRTQPPTAAQSPQLPPPYKEEEVTFSSQIEGSMLAGTLTLPKVPKAVAVIVSGSGQQTRDGGGVGHPIYRVLADYMSRHGIAVLRYDDRAVGGSRGPVLEATSRNFANDTAAALDYLGRRKDLAGKPLGVIGHSEGGMIAEMLGAERKDLSFLVLMAGPGVNSIDVMDAQVRAIAGGSGIPADPLEARLQVLRRVWTIMAGEGDVEAPLAEAKQYLATVSTSYTPAQLKTMGLGANTDALLQQVQSPWMRYFLAYDPAQDLRRIRIPVLALWGSKDTQVVATQNAPAVRAALQAAGNTHFEVAILPNLNHLFQTAVTGLPNEYSTIKEVMAPVALEKMADWINHTASALE